MLVVSNLQQRFYSTAICVPRCLKNEKCVSPNTCEVSSESALQIKQQHIATRVKRYDHWNGYSSASTGSYSYDNVDTSKWQE